MTGQEYAGQLRDQSQVSSDYWRNLYAKFNPPAATIQTPDVMSGYGQASQNLGTFGASQKAAMEARGQSLGSFDTGMNQDAIASKMNLQGMQQQHGFDMSNQNKNLGLYQDTALGQFGKMNRIGGSDQAQRRSRDMGSLGDYLTQDKIGNMQEMYKFGAQDPFASAVGAFGGNVAGAALGKDAFGLKGNVNEDDISNSLTPYYIMQGQYDKIGQGRI